MLNIEVNLSIFQATENSISLLKTQIFLVISTYNIAAHAFNF